MLDKYSPFLGRISIHFPHMYIWVSRRLCVIRTIFSTHLLLDLVHTQVSIPISLWAPISLRCRKKNDYEWRKSIPFCALCAYVLVLMRLQFEYFDNNIYRTFSNNGYSLTTTEKKEVVILLPNYTIAVDRSSVRERCM